MFKLWKKKFIRWSIDRLERKLNKKLTSTEMIEFLTNKLLKELNRQGITLVDTDPKVLYVSIWCHTKMDSDELSDVISVNTRMSRDEVQVKRTKALY